VAFPLAVQEDPLSTKDDTKPYFFTVNYRERDGKERGQVVNVGFFLHGLPRLMLLCRLFGHRPVVDGTKGHRSGDLGSRWVCCDGCGVRPDSQGSLDPEVWRIGQRYDGPYADSPPDYAALRALKLGDKMPEQPKYSLPGPWSKATGELGGQLLIGKTFGLFSIAFEIGSAGSEHTLSGHVKINGLGALYLHANGFGEWLQRRLNGTGYDDRKIGISAHDGSVYWSLWEREGHWSHDQPKWWSGSFPYDLRDVLLGQLSYSYENVGEPVPAVVRMPYGDEDMHDVVLQLQRQTLARKRGKPKKVSWTVKWTSEKGIPFRVDSWKGNEALGSSVAVSDREAEAGAWPHIAVVRIAESMMKQRIRYGLTPGQFEDHIEPAMDLG
jgi:hypothetical protein